MRVPNEDNLAHVIESGRLSYLKILQATSGFVECNLLGRRSYSSVYKGTLSDRMLVAIKVFNMELEGSQKNFDT